ncbi:MAG: sarcosine oxidase subunit delta [Pseudolabrys sp.]|nr:sarcosine oxidase subunit delta [Pseudolabrys sp.]
MRIPCPYCGERSGEEFVASGAADPQRPTDPGDLAAFVDYVYLRDNPAGPHRELFYHAGGCHSWLVVTRDTRSHAILGVTAARDAKRERPR